MKQAFVIFLLSFTLNCSAQRFHALYANFEYQTNFNKSALNGTLDYEIRFTIDSMIHLASFGLGGGVHSDHTYLTDVKFSWALTQGWICHFYWFERYPEWYIAGHYRFSPDFSRQYICPELGYNIRLDSWVFITPSVNYYWNLKCACDWRQSFYPTIKLAFKIIQDPHNRPFQWRRKQKSTS